MLYVITSQNYDYLLGGKDNFTADRAVGDKAMQAYPDLPVAARYSGLRGRRPEAVTAAP
jgi:hypothetical protein